MPERARSRLITRLIFQKAAKTELIGCEDSRAEGSKRQFSIKSGTRFIREYGGARHVVTVQGGVYEYNNKTYKSLSAIASEIAGTRWNGWTFFGVKKPAPDRSGDVA